MFFFRSCIKEELQKQNETLKEETKEENAILKEELRKQNEKLDILHQQINQMIKQGSKISKAQASTAERGVELDDTDILATKTCDRKQEDTASRTEHGSESEKASDEGPSNL